MKSTGVNDYVFTMNNLCVVFYLHRFFDTDPHEVSWRPETDEALRPKGSASNKQSERQCRRIYSKWVFDFFPMFMK